MAKGEESGPGHTIAIDLGTAHTRAGIYRSGRIEIVATVPSYVAFTSSGEVLVGDSAKNQVAANPVNTVFDVSRLIGRHYSDPLIQSNLKLWPFKIIQGPDDKPLISVQHKGDRETQFPPEKIYSIIMAKIKEITESHLGSPVKNAVVTIPNYFNHAQRQAVRDAGATAGLNIKRLVSGPAAAAMAYGLQRTGRSLGEHNVVIFDLGAGTLDVSLVMIEENIYKVKSVSGDINLGGGDFDNVMVEYFVKEFKKKHKKDITGDLRAMSRLRTACERAKKTLTLGPTTSVGIISLHDGINFHSAITRSKFEELNKNLFRKCMECVVKSLEDSNWDKGCVDEVILVGGSVRISKVQRILQGFFDGKEICKTLNPEEAIIQGATLLATVLSDQENSEFRDFLLVDATSFSLGIEIAGGVMCNIVRKNTSFPLKREHVFSTDYDNQSSFPVRVYEGEGSRTHDNNLLGEFELTGIPPAPKGVPQITVCFEIDQNGTMKVSAEDKINGLKNKITIGGKNNELTIEEDGDHKMSTEAKSLLSNYIETIREIINDEGSCTKLAHDDKKELEDAVESAVNWADKNQFAKAEEFVAKREDIDNIYNKIMERMSLDMGLTVGIDFGTTYSCVGAWLQDHVEIIPNEQGNRTTPSCVGFTENERLVGNSARDQAPMNPTNTIFDIKRIIGQHYSNQSFQTEIKSQLFKIIPGPTDRPTIVIHYKGEERHLEAEEISAMILTKMKEITESHMGSTVKNAVITVPSFFGHSQRQATKNAGQIAGLNVIGIINETTASAIAYYSQKVNHETNIMKNILVFDLGGGTIDVSVLTLTNGVFNVRSVCGNANLGGTDFDANMVGFFISEFKKKHGDDISGKPRAVRKLMSACERAKRVLSTISRTTIEIDSLYDGIDFCTAITRVEFEEINEGLFKKCMEIVEICIREADVDKSEIDEVVLVGGSTRIPKIQQLLQELFEGKELCKGINPDEVVAYGATIRAAILTGQNRGLEKEKSHNLQFRELAPFTLGLGTAGGDMTVLIPRNTVVPTKAEQVFTTRSDNQPNISTHLYECESGCLLGKFSLVGIPPLPRGVPKIRVSFQINTEGFVTLKAYDSTKEISITNDSSGLSGEQIEKLMIDLERYKADDEDHSKRIEAKNQLEDYAYKMREMARDARNSGKIYFTEKRKIERAVEQAICWLDRDRLAETSEFQGKLEELKRICQPLFN